MAIFNSYVSHYQRVLGFTAQHFRKQTIPDPLIVALRPVTKGAQLMFDPLLVLIYMFNDNI
jgi:hypothetical protein